MKSFFDIKGYRLLATHYFQGIPKRYKYQNGRVELLVWYSGREWKYFVRRIAYLREEPDIETQMLKDLIPIGIEAVDLLNKSINFKQQ